MTKQEVPDQLFMPVRMPKTHDEVMRNLRAIEEYLQAPHRTYGSRLISPLFFEQIDATDAISINAQGSGAFGDGQWDGVTIELDRRFRAYVWGAIEANNTDAAVDYRTNFYLPVTYGATEDTGVRMRNWTPNGGDIREIVNFRQADVSIDETTTVTFSWAVQSTAAGPQDFTAGRRKMIVAVFDAPDADAGVPVQWTRSTVTRGAYRHQESDDAL